MRTTIALVLFGLLAGPTTLFAQSADYGIPAHVSRVDGRAVIEREAGGEDLERNLTLTEGDRIRTLAGRVEILFADGTLLHLDRNTVVDFLREDFVRVMEGRARWMVARDARGVLRVDTPAATLELDPGGDYRVAVAPNGDAELAVLRGSGALLNDAGDTALKAGERAVAAMGRAPSQAFYANAASWDDFDRWSDTQRRVHTRAVSARYLPAELHPYGSVFDSYGSWRLDPSHGYVWYPVATVGWQPYSRGRWHSYPRYGWTWIGHDPWAWPTHHFGRWGFSSGVWFWIPGRTWAPAWVAWASSPGYVGWSPLGWNDHPIYRVNVYDARYSAGYPWCGWTFIRERHFGGHVAPGQIVIGAGVNVIARTGITPAATSPVARRAVPRHGVPAGTAVPRTGLSGSGGAQGGLARVPAARTPNLPTDTIRSGAVPRDPGSAPDVRMPREGSSTGTSARPRTRTEAEAGGQPQPTTVSGRPVRRAPDGGSADSAPRTQPRERQGDSTPAPPTAGAARARDREQPSARPAPRGVGGVRAYEPRPSPGQSAAPPDASERQYRAAPRPPSDDAPSQERPAPRAREHSERSAPRASAPPRSESRPRESAPAARAPSERPRPAPAAKPAPSSGGGGERPAPSRSGGQAQPRPRGGG